jgi:uncharacterized OsmC-like protein
MNNNDIFTAVKNVESYYRSKAPPGPQADVPATALVEQDLRCRIESPDGMSIYTDMPAAVGGGASANSPGWHLRAALASCDATLLAIRAARVGVKLDKIEVRVEGRSDGRGMFLDNGVSPGSSEMRLNFCIEGAGVSREQIEELVAWVEEHSPVGTDVSRAVNLHSEIETP